MPTESALNTPSAVAIDSKGNLYIADTGNHLVRRIGAGANTLANAAGNGGSAEGDTEGPALEVNLASPVALAVDRNDNLYIAASGGSSVWMLDAATSRLRRLGGADLGQVNAIAVGPAGV